MKKIATFDDWIDAFRAWQKDIDLELPKYSDYDVRGQVRRPPDRRDRVRRLPRARRSGSGSRRSPSSRSATRCCNLIVYQGDTEFASVEQQRNLLETSPSDYDTDSVCRIMVEEMRHGWQMCHLLVNHFGETGKIEARKLLERRSWQNNRLLGLLQRRRGQLGRLLHVHRVRRPRRQVPAQHALDVGLRAARALDGADAPRGGLPPRHRPHGPAAHREGRQASRRALLQKYINKWLSTAYDLFGKDSSSSAEWFYVWGLKGRYDEAKQPAEPDKAHLNELSRDLYRQEVDKLLESISRLLPAGAAPLRWRPT